MIILENNREAAESGLFIHVLEFLCVHGVIDYLDLSK
jgi:hypothetical protein